MHVLRDLEARNLGLQRGDHVGFAQRITRPRDDDRLDRFAEVGVGHPDDRGFRHSGERVDLLLDFLRVDVEAAGDDQVLRAADDADVAIGEDLAHVAGAKPPVGGEFLARLLRHAPVAGKHIGSLHFDAADHARGAGVAVRVDDAHRYAGKRWADGARNPFAFERIRRVHAGLGHPVALENRVSGALPEFAEGLGQERRRPGDEQPHRAAVCGAERRIREEPRVERRNAHHDRRARQ